MRLLSTFLALLGSVTAARAADWPQWLGPRRDGGSAESVEPWTKAPEVLWRAKVGLGFSSPVVVDGKAYVHARVGKKEREELIAFDAATGKVLWREGYDRAPYSSVLNTGPQATPTVIGNRIYTYGITGELACFEAATGKPVWRVDAFKKLNATLPRFGVCCSPLVVGNRVLVAVNGKGSAVAAFDADTGELQWQALDEPASTSSPILFAAKGKAGSLPVAVFMTTLRVIGLNPLDGTAAWEFPLPFQPSGTTPTPIACDDLIVTSTQTNGSTAIRVGGGDKPAAEKVWQAKGVSGYFSTGAAAGKDRLYIVTNQLKPVPRADLVCMDVGSGKELWRKEGVGYFHFGIVRTGNNKLLVLDDAGNLKLLDATASEYRELCAAKVCDGTLVAPALANGRLYARDSEEIICVQLAPQR